MYVCMKRLLRKVTMYKIVIRRITIIDIGTALQPQSAVPQNRKITGGGQKEIREKEEK